MGECFLSFVFWLSSFPASQLLRFFMPSPAHFRRLCCIGSSLLAALYYVAPAHAQVNLPLQLPRVPDVTSPLGITKVVPTLENTVDTTLRQLKVRELLRQHRDVIDRDPRGEPIVRGELLGFGVSGDALLKARAAGFELLRTTPLEGLDLNIVALKPPPRLSIEKALKQLRDLDPQGTYDFNHIYLTSGEVTTPAIPQDTHASEDTHADASRADASRDTHAAALGATSIGLIDGGIERHHPAIGSGNITTWGCSGRAIPSAHGTAIASLMIGNASTFHGVAPGAALYAADVYCDLPTGGAVETIAAAFAWVASNQVGVINVSLVGPSNVTLQQVVRIMNERGHLIVAAVGNDGPNSPPLYPAAYPGVVAVTGVDKKRRVLIEAVRGPHVMFAAPGADMIAATQPDTYHDVRGTSFASPIVAALLASRLQHPDRTGAQTAVQSLQMEALDLGPRGRDDTYGFGLVGDGAVRVER